MRKLLVSALTLLLPFSMYGCTQKAPEQADEPVYAACTILYDLGEGRYALGYEIHLKEPMAMEISAPEDLYGGIIQPSENQDKDLLEQFNSRAPHCAAVGYNSDWYIETMMVEVKEEDLPDLTKKLLDMPVKVSFHDEKAGETYSHEKPFPVYSGSE